MAATKSPFSPEKFRKTNFNRGVQGGNPDYKPVAPTSHDSIRPDFLAGTEPIGPEEEKAMEGRAYSGAADDIARHAGLSSNALRSREEAGGSPQPTEADQEEGDSPGLFKGNGRSQKKGKGRFSPRQKLIAGGGVTSIVIAIIFGIFSILHGPLEIIHFAQLLTKFHFSNNEDFMDGRTTKFLNGLRRKSPAKNHLGFIGNKFADRFERRLQANSGLRSLYDDTTGRFVGYEIIDPEKARDSVGEFKDDKIAIDDSAPDHVHAIGSDGKSVPHSDIKGKVVNMKEASARVKRSSIRAATKGTGTNKLAASLGSRLEIIRGAVDFHPLKNIQRKAEDKILDYYRARRKERAERDRTGSTAPDPKLKPLQEEDKDGKPLPPEGDQNQAIQEGEAAATEAKNLHGGEEGSLNEATASNAKKLIGGGVAAVGLLCTIRSISEKAADLQYLNIVLPLIRIGMRIMTTGFQVMSNVGVNVDELGSVVNDLYDTQAKLPWNAARSIQAENGDPQTGPDMPAVAKPDFIGNKPQFFQIIDTIFNKAGPAGTAVCSTAGQFALSAVTGFGDAIAGFLQGAAASALGIPDPQQIIADWVTRKLAGEEVDYFAKGAKLGNYANYGSRLAANDQAISSGGRELSDTEVAELDAASQANQQYEFSKKSMFAKVFDVNDTNSVLAKASMSIPSSPALTFTALMRSPLRILSISHLFSQPVAAKTTYNYGFPEFGFSLAEQNDPKYEDPFDNAEVVESKLPELNKKYKDCFSIEVNPDTGELKSGKVTRYDKIKENSNCHDGSEDLVRYRFYLADRVTEDSLGCYEGDDDSCKQLGFGVTVDTGGNTNGPTDGKIVGDIGESSDNVPCANGTNDLGIVESKYTGSAKKTSGPLKIRLCQVPVISGNGDNAEGNNVSGGAVVNSRVSGAWLALGSAAAKDNTPLSASSSFRYNDSCGGGGDGGACATPGSSYHQLGIAIDFAGINGIDTSAQSCDVRVRDESSPSWVWLHDHAESYGFKQYSAEAWHWDAAQATNRCGGG